MDALAAIGSPITEDDHIEYIIDDLPEEYDSFMTIILSRHEPYTLDELKLCFSLKKSVSRSIKILILYLKQMLPHLLGRLLSEVERSNAVRTFSSSGGRSFS